MLRFVARLIRNVLCVPFAPFWAIARWFGRPKGPWVVVRLKPRLVEARQPLPWLRRILESSAIRRTSSLAAIRRLADYVISDRAIQGVAFVLPPMTGGWSVCVGFRDQIQRLRRHGKATVVMLQRGGGHKELYVASAAERVYMAPRSTITLLGLSASSHYVKPLLDRVGVEVEPFARKEFKTAAERLTRESMSGPQREQLQAVIDGYTENVLVALAERTGTTPELARELFETGVFRGEDAIAAGLVDELAYEDELEVLLDCDKKHPLMEANRYFAFKERRLFRPLRRRPYIAVVAIKGAISESGAPMGRRASIVGALRRARRDRRALGVLLWVDSPGGSAEASDLIHREVVRVKEKKPVVAYFGEVAASGGYYVAAHVDSIVAQPLSLTGSIGVVSARLLAKELLERAGIRTEVLRTGPHADLFSPHRALTKDERALMNRELDAFYDSFVGLVAEGRGRPIEEIEPLARGRVWLATDAHRLGLVDELGGMDSALDLLKSRIDVAPRLRERLEPMVIANYRLEPPAPTAQAWIDESILGTLKDLGLLLSEGSGVLYHVISVPRVR
ncbi:MAG: signal peptide peptidase SppA [Myxococcales bacterium]|nr:signal peptide peptidase SppA [Myxococcales bacterium]MDH3485749.1 signal peptide peptidase SppA [Myxococcales bacterium]